MGKDKSGILVFGESVNVGNRLLQFLNASNGRRVPHAEGERLFLVQYKSQFQKQVHKDTKIQFTVMQLSSKTEAEQQEEKVLKLYFQDFGELPPLNSTLEDKHFPDWKNLGSPGLKIWQ
jgi:hypothetical protein